MAKNFSERLGPVETMSITAWKPGTDVLVRVTGVIETYDGVTKIGERPLPSRTVTTDWLVTRGIWTAAQRTNFHAALGALRTGIAAQFPIVRADADVEDDLS